MNAPKYKRILLKLSGEALMGDSNYGINPQTLSKFTDEIKAIHELGIQIGIVIGGGNIYRGLQAKATGIHKVTGDQMGMLATVMNCLAFQSSLESKGIASRLQTAITMEAIAEPYIRRRAIRHLEKGRVVLFAAGTGSPYFTTDSAAALRAVEIEADVLLKGTRVDGIYDCDPEKNTNAVKFETLKFRETIEKNLKVMDQTAFTLCSENQLPIIVFDINIHENLKKIVLGENIGTIVK